MKTIFRGLAMISLSALFYTVNAAPQLLAHWSFDSYSGNTYYDVTGHGYNAIATGTGVGLAPGVKGQALSLPGSGYEISAANSKNDFYLSTYSIESWYYSNTDPSTIPGYSEIFCYTYLQSGVRNGISLALYQQGNFFLSTCNSDGSTWVDAASSVYMSPGKWYHVVGTYDGSYLRIYVNGTLTGSTAYSGTFVKPTIDARIACGRRMDNINPVWFINGYIDELKLYNYALPADSVLAHYKALIPPATSSTPACSLIAHWSFDSSSGNTYYDVTGHGYDAIATGTGVGLAPGVKCRALSLPGSGYEIYAANSSNDFYIPRYSIECWFYSNISPRFSEYVKIFDYQYVQSGGYNGYVLFLSLEGNLVADMSNASGTAWNTTWDISSTTITAGRWYHLTSTYDGTSIKVYVDGVLCGSRSYSGTYVKPPNNARIACARRSDYSNAVMLVNGRIDELKLYREALPADSILAHYNAPKGCVPFVIPCSTHTCDRRPTCKWRHREHGNGCYSLQINNSPDFASPLLAASVDDTFFAPGFDLPLGNVYWRVGSTEPEVSGYSLPDTFSIIPATGITESNAEKTLPTSASIVQLSHGIAVNYWLEKQGAFSMDIVSFTGVRVATVNKGTVPAGKHILVWDRTDKQGKLLPAGSYIAVCRINNHSVLTKKIILLQ